MRHKRDCCLHADMLRLVNHTAVLLFKLFTTFYSVGFRKSTTNTGNSCFIWMLGVEWVLQCNSACTDGVLVLVLHFQLSGLSLIKFDFRDAESFNKGRVNVDQENTLRGKQGEQRFLMQPCRFTLVTAELCSVFNLSWHSDIFHPPVCIYNIYSTKHYSSNTQHHFLKKCEQKDRRLATRCIF